MFKFHEFVVLRIIPIGRTVWVWDKVLNSLVGDRFVDPRMNRIWNIIAVCIFGIVRRPLREDPNICEVFLSRSFAATVLPLASRSSSSVKIWVLREVVF